MYKAKNMRKIHTLFSYKGVGRIKRTSIRISVYH